MAVKIIEGNLVISGEKLKCHQVNCIGIIGATGKGLAKQLRDRYPEMYREYKYLTDSNKKDPRELLGTCQVVLCKDGTRIANLFAQENINKGFSWNNRQVTEMWALEKSLLHLKDFATRLQEIPAFPHGLGSLRGGASWEEVLELLIKVFGEEGFVLYRYNK